MAGSIIAASLITGLNSDLPGTVIAPRKTKNLTEHVFDTVTGRVLLIPQGSRLIGRPFHQPPRGGGGDSVIAFGQSRALVVWHRIVMPDGSSVQIDNLPATDPAGYAGLEDGVDYHVDRLATGVVLATLLGVGSELTLGESESELVRALRESLQGTVDRTGSRLTERFLDGDRAFARARKDGLGEGNDPAAPKRRRRRSAGEGDAADPETPSQEATP